MQKLYFFTTNESEKKFSIQAVTQHGICAGLPQIIEVITDLAVIQLVLVLTNGQNVRRVVLQYLKTIVVDTAREASSPK